MIVTKKYLIEKLTSVEFWKFKSDLAFTLSLVINGLSCSVSSVLSRDAHPWEQPSSLHASLLPSPIGGLHFVHCKSILRPSLYRIKITK